MGIYYTEKQSLAYTCTHTLYVVEVDILKWKILFTLFYIMSAIQSYLYKLNEIGVFLVNEKPLVYTLRIQL